MKSSLSLLAVATGVAAHEIPERARGGSAWREQATLSVLKDSSSNDAQYWNHPLDNFAEDPSASTFDSRYYVNDDYHVDGGPNFIYIGGEGPVTSAPSGFVAELAQEHGARIVALEHRFYGESMPCPDDLACALSVDNLAYLTVEQALFDLQSFLKFFDAEGEWFAFGGSYPGALSAWFRLAYPDATVGSLASSGVVDARFEFPEFDEQVAESAGEDCADAVRATTAALERAMADPASADATRALFNAEALVWGADFWYMAADSAAMAVQYGQKDALCSPLGAAYASGAGGDDALIATFANVTKSVWGDDFGGNCFYDTTCLRDAGRAADWAPTSRSWRWQKCAQLAYFQVAPESGSLRSAAVDLQYHLDQCDEVFGAGVTDAKGATAAINGKFGGAAPAGEAIFFSNGSDDPWQQASIAPLDSESESEPAVLAVCDGCGHCGDLHGSTDSDPANLTAQREAIADFVAKRLSA